MVYFLTFPLEFKRVYVYFVFLKKKKKKMQLSWRDDPVEKGWCKIFNDHMNIHFLTKENAK